MERSRPVRILGHPGRLRDGVLVPVASETDGTLALVWEGAVDGPGLARILRTVLARGSLACDVEGAPFRIDAGSCWYDAAHGTLLVEVRGDLQPVA